MRIPARAELFTFLPAPKSGRALGIDTQGAKPTADAFAPPKIALIQPTAMAPKSPYDADVLVIGAGLAGVAAAKQLTAHGASVLVLEAQAHIGGRALTDTETFDAPVDLGGAWLHNAPNNPLKNVAQAHGLKPYAHEQTYTAYVDGKPATAQEEAALANTEERIEQAWENAALRGEDHSAAALLPNDAPHLNVATVRLGPHEYAVEMDQVSSLDATSQHFGADQLLPQGFGTLVNKMAEGLHIKTNNPVNEICWSAAGVKVKTTSGRTFTAKRLIVTVSTGVLASGAIKFNPPLPKWKREAIAGVPMGLMNKIIMQFAPNPAFDAVAPSTWVTHTSADATDKDMAFLVRPAGSNLVVGFVGGNTAHALESKTDAQALDLARQKLGKVFGKNVNRDFQKGSVTRWGQNPYTLGAYSAARPGMAKMRQRLQKSLSERLYFAGEAIGDAPERAGSQAAQAAQKGEKHWATQLPGAYLSGQNAAQEILASVQRELQAQPKAQKPLALQSRAIQLRMLRKRSL